MPSFLNLLCATLLLALPHFANAQVSESATRFPVVASYNLDKTKATLPGDLKGEINLVILPFELEQEKEADTWKSVAQEVEAARQDFRHYLVPVFNRENILYRWWMSSSLRSTFPSDDERQSTIPLYVNRKKFLGALAITSDREITVLLVEKNGRILWRATGPLTEAKRASFETALGAFNKMER